MAKQLRMTEEFFRRRDEWRKHLRLSNQLRHALIGLDRGDAAFGIYLVGEQVYNKLIAPSSSSSSSHHSSHSCASHRLTETTKTTTSSEMVEAMKKVAKLDMELTVEKRNLVSVGYKNVIEARRALWRILSSIEQKE